MMSAFSNFSRTTRIFENVRHMSLIRHEFEHPPVVKLIQISSRFFHLLDRTDPSQAEISRRLWVLRSSVVFTLLPFDDPDLKLLLQVNELETSSHGIPDAEPLIESLRKCVTDIMGAGRNPKREWLIGALAEHPRRDSGKIGMFLALSGGRSPGWPQEKSEKLAELMQRMLPITSKIAFRSDVFQKVILPCACSNVSPLLLSQLLYSGVTATVEVLLYPGERFQVPKRLLLPDDRVFANHLQKSKIEREVVAVPRDPADVWVNEAFWQGLHGAARSEEQGLSPARYLLFCDGTGTFLPEIGRVMTLPADGSVQDENDLYMIPVDDVSEGDMVVLRSGASGFLLDEISARIMGYEENENLFETATDWKNALDALLVTHSSEEVAQAIREGGVSVSAASINQWVGPEVLGPGKESVFRALINLLAVKGKLHIEVGDLVSYADCRWQSLQALRGLHQKAGNLIRQDLFKALFSHYANESRQRELPDRESIHIDGDTAAELLVLRVSCVDGNTAYVEHSRLGKLDDLKGNKWLG